MIKIVKYISSKDLGLPKYPDFTDLTQTQEVKKIIEVLSKKISSEYISEEEKEIYNFFTNIAYDFTRLEHLQVRAQRKFNEEVPYPLLANFKYASRFVSNPIVLVNGLSQKIDHYMNDKRFSMYSIQLSLLQKLLKLTDPKDLQSLYLQYSDILKKELKRNIWPQFIVDIESRDINQDITKTQAPKALRVGMYLLIKPQAYDFAIFSKIKKPRELDQLVIGYCIARGADATTQSNSGMVINGGAYFTIPEFIQSNRWFLGFSERKAKRHGIPFNKEDFLNISFNMLIQHEAGHRNWRPSRNYKKNEELEDIYSEYFADANTVLTTLNKIAKTRDPREKLKHLLILCCYYDIDRSDLKEEENTRDIDNLAYEYSISKVLIWRLMIRAGVVRYKSEKSVEYSIEKSTLERFRKLIQSQRENPKDLRVLKENQTPQTQYESHLMLLPFPDIDVESNIPVPVEKEPENNVTNKLVKVEEIKSIVVIK